MNEERSMNEDVAMIPHVLEVNGIHLHYVTWGQFRQPHFDFRENMFYCKE